MFKQPRWRPTSMETNLYFNSDSIEQFNFSISAIDTSNCIIRRLIISHFDWIVCDWILTVFSSSRNQNSPTQTEM